MKPNKKLAAGLAAALAMAGVATVGMASSASAATFSTATIHGSPVNEAGTTWYDNGAFPTTPTPVNPAQTITLTAIPGTPGNIDVSVAVTQGPYTSSLAGAASNGYRLDAFVNVGATPRRLIGNLSAAAIGTNAPTYVGGTTITGTVPGSVGSNTVTLTSLLMDSVGQGSPVGFGTLADGSDAAGFDAWYNLGTTTAQIVARTAPIGLTESVTLAGPNAAISSINNNPSGTAVNGVRTGDSISVTGNSLWGVNQVAASGTQAGIAIQTCDAGALTGCSPLNATIAAAQPITAGSLSTDGSGQLAPFTYTASTNNAVGDKDVYVVQTAGPLATTFFGPGSTQPAVTSRSSASPVTFLGVQTVTGPSTVSPGAANAITGTNWYPGETVTITAGTDSTTDVADADGNISTSLTVDDTSATAFVATGIGPLTANSPFVISAASCVVTDLVNGCDTSQTIIAEVEGGTLSQAAAPTGTNGDATLVDLGATPTSVTAATLSGDLNSITVTDNRGGLLGWSLTANIDGPMTAVGGATISEANLSGTATCAPVAAGSATGVSTGGLQDYSGPVDLCTKSTLANSAGDTTGGTYLAEQNLDLVVPAFQAAGNYSAVVTITLV